MTEDSRPPLAPVICLADIELLLAWLWALELLVPVIITACPSWAMAVKNMYLSSFYLKSVQDSCANLVSFKIGVLFVLICIESTTVLKETRFAQLSS